MKPFQFREYTCTMDVKTYQDGSPAIQLFDDEGPVARVTQSIPNSLPKIGNIFVKDCDEQAGMAEALIKGGFAKIAQKHPFDSGIVEMEIIDPELKELIIAATKYKSPKKDKATPVPAGPDMAD